ncbi:MAG: ATP-binding protein [Acidobacteriota bacterium]
MTRGNHGLLSILALGILVTSVGGAAIHVTFRQTLNREVREQGQTIARAIAAIGITTPESESLQRVVTDLGGADHAVLIVVAAGSPPHVVASTEPRWRGARLDRWQGDRDLEDSLTAMLTTRLPSAGGAVKADVETAAATILITPIERVGELAQGAVAVLLSTDARWAPLRRTAWLLTLVLGVVTLGGIGLGYALFDKRVAGPTKDPLRSLEPHALVFEMTRDGQFTRTNANFCAATGYEAAELVGQNLSLFHSEQHSPEFWSQIRRALMVHGVWRGEVCLSGRSGQPCWIDALVVAIRDERADPQRSVWFGTEITQRKQAEQALSESLVQRTVERDQAREAERAKAEFLATMSHEIRTPLNAIIGFSNLLSQTPLNDEQGEFVNTVSTSAESLLGVINDVLDFSKIEADRLTIEQVPFDLVGVAEDVVELLSTQADVKSLDLVVEHDADAPTLLVGDPVRVRQVLINLAGNAVKFTGAGHVRIAIKSTRSTTRDVTIPLIEVSDTGIGIPPEKISSLFQRFSQVDASTTRKFGGTGLGLAISRRLVELMGGETGVRSEQGRGSTFWFTLESTRLEVAAPTPIPEMLVSTTAMIVTASDTISETLSRWLTERGLRCLRYDTIDQSMEALEDAGRTGAPVRTLIVDWLLPDGTAEQLARRVASLTAGHAPALVVLARPSERGEVPGGIFDALMLKPVVRRSSIQKALQQVARRYDASSTASSAASVAAIASPVVPTPDILIARNVLVAEDNLINQRLAAHLLRKLGCELTFANNGREAVDQALRTRFDLILMDCQMPELDGFEATAEIRRGEPEGVRVPIVALTANAMQGDRERCIAAGMDDYLTKPIRPDDLRRALERWATAGAEIACG